jgi:hypothetical protein
MEEFFEQDETSEPERVFSRATPTTFVFPEAEGYPAPIAGGNPGAEPIA